jgi:glycerol-3-phosphate O-acyltransferase
LTYLTITPSLEELSLDLSCNRKITFGDFLNLGTKIKRVKKIELNLDFCTEISEDVIEEVVTLISHENKCLSLSLSDRNYSVEFQDNVVPQLMASSTLIEFNISAKIVSKRLKVF